MLSQHGAQPQAWSRTLAEVVDLQQLKPRRVPVQFRLGAERCNELHCSQQLILRAACSITIRGR
jgi:hypothetical protein